MKIIVFLVLFEKKARYLVTLVIGILKNLNSLAIYLSCIVIKKSEKCSKKEITRACLLHSFF